MCDALTSTSHGSDAGFSTENCISSAIKSQKNVKWMEIVGYLCSKYHYRSNYKTCARYFLAKISSPYEISKLFACSFYQDFMPIIYLL